ncbi:peptidase inhibitor family I36 protein [Actinokineospora terrae]|uniref:Peptidase inhibitor family I36 n=1 Tax=Actinokineospora terrae TaxID=155974 RepID=A0A1H9MCI7_9PSEU|nr:peptidase inhibitor family I36 protein [Actinokineospora terrae]SER21394.1 Peptidase inhibitor family I36 [Actinokineospora terrae]
MRTSRRVVAAMAIAAVAALAVPQVAAAAPVAWECNTGNICFYTGPDGTGSRCMWDVADPDWATGGTVCSWALTTNVKSVWNRGTSSASGVAYYRNVDYVNRAGCTRQGQSGNLAGTYKLRSHKWISGSCG